MNDVIRSLLYTCIYIYIYIYTVIILLILITYCKGLLKYINILQAYGCYYVYECENLLWKLISVKY